MNTRRASEKISKKEREAPIEFVTERSLDDCLFRLREMKNLNTGFIAPGMDVLYGQLDNGLDYFILRRTWYDYRWRRQTWQVELRGYLRGMHDGSTFVGAEVRLARTWWLVLLVMTGLLIASVILTMMQGTDWFSTLLISVLPIYLLLQLYFDRRLLIRRLYRALGSDV